jgi:hypothetical protein
LQLETKWKRLRFIRLKRSKSYFAFPERLLAWRSNGDLSHKLAFGCGFNTLGRQATRFQVLPIGLNSYSEALNLILDFDHS